jgi:hypothetical protein
MLIAKKEPTTSALIAPCGLDCRLCRAYAREKNPCPGCRSEDNRHKAAGCITCRIKNCRLLVEKGLEFCSGDCPQYPCADMLRLNKRYTSKYTVSPLENLNGIRENGLDRFVESENTKWACPRCGSLLCMHKAECLACEYEWRTQG